MREIVLGTGIATQYIHMLLAGKISSGKTSFAATAPAPLFLGYAPEGGYETLEPPPHGKFNTQLLWDPDVLPAVWAMEGMADYFTAIAKLTEMAKTGKLPYRTLVFDSVSVYTQLVVSELAEKNPKNDPRQNYGSLGDAITLLVKRIHALPMHVIWLCHTDDTDSLLVSGKATHTAWANMGTKLLVRADVNGKVVNYQIQTKPFRLATWIGVRSFSPPDPMIPSFKALAYFAGLNEYPASAAMPAFNGVDLPFGAIDPATGAQYPLVAAK
jgi:hypothetical protein